MIAPASNPNLKLLSARTKEAAERGDGDTLLALAHEIASHTAHPGLADAAVRLMSLTQKCSPQHVLDVAKVLVDARTQASRPYLVMLSALDAAAPFERGVERFMANRRQANDILRAAIVSVPATDAKAQRLRLRLARVLWQIGDEEKLSHLLTEVDLRAKEGDSDPTELAKLALLCMNSRHGSTLRETVRAALEREPSSPDLLRAYVRGLITSGQDIDHVWPRLKQAAKDNPEDEHLQRFTATCAYRVCDWEVAHRMLLRLGRQYNNSEDWEKAGMALLRLGDDEQAVQCFDQARPRVRGRDLGPLADILEAFLKVLNRDYEWCDRIDHQAFKDELTLLVAHLRQRISTSDFSPTHFLQAANVLHAVETCPFYILEQTLHHQPYITEWDARYGTFDLKAYAIIWRALVEHQALLLDAALERLLVDGTVGTLNALREITGRFTAAHLTLDRPTAALQKLTALIAQGCEGLFFEELVDRCLLHEGRIRDVEARMAARLGPHECEVTVCAVAQADEWIRREQLEARVLWEEGPFEGTFQKIGSDGQIETHFHRIGEFTLRGVRANSLIVAGSELIIGANGTVLRPSYWHYRSLFPERTGLARTTAINGTVLNLTGTVRRIEEPVIILAVNDTLRQRNYYHWINFILTRCAFLLEQGWLQDRRLLMPHDLLPWMREALELVNIGDRLLPYSNDEVLHITDGMVISAFDYPGAEYMRRFRNFMWNAARVKSPGTPSENAGPIFMVRPINAKRPMFGLDRIIRIAQEEGYRCVNPAEITVADQVRLFQTATCVAGFGGAAFTNIAFCRSGIPALELTRRETTWPDFAGIALALGIRYRFCPGWIDPSARGTQNVHDGSTRFDEAMVRQELIQLTISR